MKRARSISLQLFAAALSGGLLSGCLVGSPPASFYVLESLARPDPADDPAEADPLAIVVGPVRLPAYLDRPQIVTRRGSELEIDEFNRWAGTLRSEILRTLVADLGVRLRTDRITGYPASLQLPVDHRVELTVEQFEAVDREEVVLNVRWTVVPGSGGNAQISSRTVRSRHLDSPGYPRLVRAHSELLSELSAEIAERVLALPPSAVRAQPAP